MNVETTRGLPSPVQLLSWLLFSGLLSEWCFSKRIICTDIPLEIKPMLAIGEDHTSKGNWVTIGVDESGIYSFAGPRPYIGVICFPTRNLEKLEEEGIRGKSHHKHERDILKLQRLREKISKYAVYCESIAVSHELMDSYRKLRISRHEAECLIIQDILLKVSKILANRGYRVKKIVIDKIRMQLRPSRYYFDDKVKITLESAIGAEIIVEEEADENYIECKAASIVAYEAFKNEQLNIQNKFGKVGSGHPSDNRTEEWLRKRFAGHRSLSMIPHQTESARIKKILSREYHVLDIRWETPYDFRDIGRGLSIPYLVLKDIFRDRESENLEYVNLKKDIRLRFAVFEKRCPGIWLNGLHIPCSYIDSKNIQGRRLTGRKEACKDCSAKTPPIKCVFNPMCDGYDALCGFEDFGIGFCANLHANYIFCFKDVVKIGQTFYYLLGQRLLQQGPAYAMVYCISPNRKTARRIEKFSAEICRKRKRSLKRLGIERVRQKSPSSEFISNSFSENWKGEGDLEKLQYVYDATKRTIQASEFKEFFLDDPIEIELLGDYKRPYTIPSILNNCAEINGKSIGIRGHFLYIDGGTSISCIDLNSLRRKLIHGEIAYAT